MALVYFQSILALYNKYNTPVIIILVMSCELHFDSHS